MNRSFRVSYEKRDFLVATSCRVPVLTLGATDKNIRQSLVPTPLLPEKVIDFLINEVSGEIQLDNEQLLAAFRGTAKRKK